MSNNEYYTSTAMLVSRLRNNFKRYCFKTLHPRGLNISWFYYLDYIEKNPGCSLNDLTVTMKVTKAHTTQIVAKLVENNFIVKNINAQDKRAFHLIITPAGSDIIQEMLELFRTWDELALSGLSNKEEQVLIKRLNDIYQLRNRQEPAE